MSLISFHRVLIACGILFCVGYAIWEVRSFAESGRPLSLLIALAFIVGAVALGYYLRHLTRLLRLDRRP